MVSGSGMGASGWQEDGADTSGCQATLQGSCPPALVALEASARKHATRVARGGRALCGAACAGPVPPARQPTWMRSDQAPERAAGSSWRSCCLSSIQSRPRTLLPSERSATGPASHPGSRVEASTLGRSGRRRIAAPGSDGRRRSVADWCRVSYAGPVRKPGRPAIAVGEVQRRWVRTGKGCD